MKKVFYIIFLSICLCNLSAQKFEYKYDFGQKFKYSHSYINTISGSDEIGFVGLRKPVYTLSQKNYLETYSPSLDPINKVLLKLKINGDRLRVWKDVVIENNIFVLYWRKESLTSTLYIYLHQFDKETLKPIGDIKLLMEIENHEFLGDQFGVDLALSKDSSKIILTGIKYVSDKEELENKYFVYNSSFKKIYEKTIYVDHIKSIQQHEHVIVTNEGEVYAVMNMQEEGHSAYTTQIFKISQFKEAITYDISEQNIYPQALRLYDTEDENIYCLGIYKNDTNSYSTHGTIFVHIDHVNDKILQDYNLPFDYKKLIGADTIENASNALLEGQLTVKEVVRIGDQFVLMLEEYDEDVQIGESAGMTELTYFYNDIIMCAYSKEGELNWIQQVKKFQPYALNGEATPASFKPYVYKDKIYFAKTSADEKLHGIHLYSVDVDGNMTSSQLEKIDGEPFFIRPYSSLGIGNELFLPVQLGEKYLRVLRIYLD